MLLFDSAVLRVGMSKDEVQFVVVTTLVGTEHNGIGSLVVELSKVGLGVHAAGKQLNVRTTAILTFLCKLIEIALLNDSNKYETTRVSLVMVLPKWA